MRIRYFSAAKARHIRSNRDRPYLEAAPSIKAKAFAEIPSRLPSPLFMDVLVSNKLLPTKTNLLKCHVSTHASAYIRLTPEICHYYSARDRGSSFYDSSSRLQAALNDIESEYNSSINSLALHCSCLSSLSSHCTTFGTPASQMAGSLVYGGYGESYDCELVLVI